MLTKYDSQTYKQLKIINEKSKIMEKTYLDEIDSSILVEGLKNMLKARLLDQMAISYQRQGRMYTYPPNLGQEAISVAAGMVLEKEDWLVPAYRELGAWLAKGMSIKEFFLYWSGHEDGARLQNAHNMLPISVPIASQLLHGVGIGYALKYKKQKGCVFAFAGDGGTSEGDFHEALNFAGVWKVPVVFVIQNNGYAISCPTHKQTASKTIAIKSVAYGIKGIQVDGNDLAACYYSMKNAKEYAIENNSPILIEAVTYRAGAHTTSDDPGRYRDKEEEEKWMAKDPIKRLRQYLTNNGIWNESDENKLSDQYKKEIELEFSKVENYEPYKLEDCFNYMFEEKPDELKMQQHDYEQFTRFQEGLK